MDTVVYLFAKLHPKRLQLCIVFSLKQGRKHMQLIAFPIFVHEIIMLLLNNYFYNTFKIHLGK